MTAFSVDTAALGRLAARIRQATALVGPGTDPDRLHPAVAALGAPGLVRAADIFLERWRAGLAELADDANRLADAVELVARAYQDAEAATERGLVP